MEKSGFNVPRCHAKNRELMASRKKSAVNAVNSAKCPKPLMIAVDKKRRQGRHALSKNVVAGTPPWRFRSIARAGMLQNTLVARRMKQRQEIIPCPQTLRRLPSEDRCGDFIRDDLRQCQYTRRSFAPDDLASPSRPRRESLGKIQVSCTKYKKHSIIFRMQDTQRHAHSPNRYCSCNTKEASLLTERNKSISFEQC